VPLGRGDLLTLNLFSYQSTQFPEVTVTAVRDRVVPTSTGRGYVWSGHVQGSNSAASPVTIAVEHGVMSANVRANGSSYQVRYTPAGVQVITEVDERQIPPDNHIRISQMEALQLALARQGTRAATPAVPSEPRRASPGTAADTGTTIDVLVAYTAAARDQECGASTSCMVALINTAIAEANTAYANSQVPQAMRLVGTLETSYTSAGLASGLVPDLQRVTGLDANNRPDPNAPMADVRQARENLRADLVSLWVEGVLAPNTPGTVGIAWVMNSSYLNNMQAFSALGYSVVAARYGSGPAHTFAHETGHNLGANHDHTTDASLPFTPLYPYAFDFVAPGNTFRTVMAYQSACNNCPVILNYSNPNVTFNGVATGVAGSGPTAADNHQTLINTINAVINFRQCSQQPCGATPTAVPPSPTAVPPPPATATPRTPTSTATPTPIASCNPRPAVSVNAVNAGGGVLQVTIAAVGNIATAPRLRQLQIGAATNALIDIPLVGLTNITDNRSVSLPVETRNVTLTVRHASPGSSTTVPLTVVDGCGSWPTLVGGGANAF
jgi:hypothetical protein